MNVALRARGARLARLVAINLLLVVALLVFVEGALGYIQLTKDALTTHAVAERRHTQFDAELGWVNTPSVKIPNMYGPGIGLTINAQGFRAAHDVTGAVPPAKVRVICSGDSFTLGFGVADDQTWCERLTALDPHVESVNLGQGGYGVDQAYLLYRRVAPQFAANIHLMAMITDDFARMESDRFLGYAKPTIALDHGALVVEHVPVPSASYRFSWLTANLPNLQRLHTFTVLARVFGRWLPTPAGSGAGESGHSASTGQVVQAIFADLKGFDDARATQLALVYLPTIGEVRAANPPPMGAFLREQAARLGVPFINVLEVFRTLPPDSVTAMFIPEGQSSFPAAAGHLSVRGNDLAARVIVQALQNPAAGGLSR